MNPDELTSKLRTLLSHNNNTLNRDLTLDSDRITMDGDHDVEHDEPQFERDDLLSDNQYAIGPLLEQI